MKPGMVPKVKYSFSELVALKLPRHSKSGMMLRRGMSFIDRVSVYNIVQCTVYNVQYTVLNVDCILYNVHCTSYQLQDYIL